MSSPGKPRAYLGGVVWLGQVWAGTAQAAGRAGGVGPHTLFFSSVWPASKSQHQIKSEWGEGMKRKFLAESGGRAGSREHERPREKRIWVRLSTLPFRHQGKGHSSGNELFVMKMSMRLSLATHYSTPMHSCYPPAGSLWLLPILDLLLLVPLSRLILGECGSS